MSPVDIHFVRVIGYSIQVSAANLIVHTFLYGVFFLLFCTSTVVFIRRGLTTRTQWIMFMISVICFALFSLYWAISVITVITLTKSVLIDNIALPEVDNARIYNIKMQTIKIIGEAIVESLPIISDTVVVWRAWTILPSQRRLVIGPIVILVCTIVMTILHLLTFYNSVPALQGNVLVINGFFAAVYISSIATNLTATLLIFYNLWNHRKRVSALQKSRSQGEKILAILVESGLMYCAIQVILLVLGFIYSIEDLGIIYAYHICSIVYVGTSAMYPVIVILLVRLQRSFEHTYGFSLVSQVQEHEYRNTSHLHTIGQLRFASTTSNNIMSREYREILEEIQEKESNV